MKIRTMTLLTILIAITMLFTAPGWADYDDSLRMFLRLDEASGATIAVDSAGSHNGDIEGDTTAGVAGAASYSGTAYYFDGDTDYIDLGAFTWGATTDMTISAWVKKGDVGAAFITDEKEGGTTGTFAFLFDASNYLKIIFQRASGSTTLSSVGAMAPDEWLHVVATTNATDVKLYVNGAENASTSGTFGNLRDDALSETIIGADSGTPDGGASWKGSIDELTVWTRDLVYDATNGGEIGAAKDYGIHLLGGVTGGLEDLSLMATYSADDIYRLCKLYDDQTGSYITADLKTWYYTANNFGGSYGDGQTLGGEYYITLGSGLTTNTSPIPEPASVLFALAGLGLVIKRKFRG